MKSRVHIIGLLAVLIFVGFSSQLHSAGIIKKETRQISGTKYLVNNTSAKIVVSLGDKDEATIETEEQFLSKVQFSQSGNKLTIDTENGFYNVRHFVIYITLKECKGVRIKGSGDFISTGQLRTNDFTLLIEGSGDANIAYILSDKLTVALFGSGDLVVGGECKVFNSEITGSGDVNAIKVRCKDANVKISGSGDCAIDPIEALNVKLTGSGDVVIKNEPKAIKTSIAGSGEIRKY